MRILGISGSLRRDSHNTELLRAAAALLPPGAELELWEDLKGVPPYDADDDFGLIGRPESLRSLDAAIRDADAVLFSTPEYNHSIPGALKNALDWISRPLAQSPLRGKPVAVVGASTGLFGAVWAQAEVRKVLGAIGARVVDRELPVGLAAEAFDEHGTARRRRPRADARRPAGRAPGRGPAGRRDQPSAASTRAAATGIGSASPIVSSGDARRLVDVADAGQPGQLAGAGARVEPFRVAPLALGERGRDEHLDERHAGGLVDRARSGAVGGVGRDERDERDDARLGEQRGSVRGTADVLGAVLGAEAEVAVEPVAQVVAVEPQRRPPGSDQQRLDLDGERRLARRGQAGEPDRRALEPERGGAVLRRDGAVVPAGVGGLHALDDSGACIPHSFFSSPVQRPSRPAPGSVQCVQPIEA